MPVTPPRYWNGYRWVDLAAGGDRGAPLPHQTDPAEDRIRPRMDFRTEEAAPAAAAPELRDDRPLLAPETRTERRLGFDVIDSGPTLEEAKRKFEEVAKASFGAAPPRVPISIGGTAVVVEETPVAQILSLGADPKR